MIPSGEKSNFGKLRDKLRELHASMVGVIFNRPMAEKHKHKKAPIDQKRSYIFMLFYAASQR